MDLRSIIKVILVLWLPLILFGGNPELKAQKQRVLKIGSTSSIDYCSGDNGRFFEVSIDAGSFSISDSLMSFQLGIKYDTTKVQFITGLYSTGTLAKYFEKAGVDLIPDSSGKVLSLWATQWMSQIPVTGSSKLIAFQCKYKENCTDSVLFEVVFAELEMSQTNDELVYDSLQSRLIMNAPVVDNSNRKIALSCAEDSLKFENDDRNNELTLNLDCRNVSFFEKLYLTAEIQNGNLFSIDSVISLSNNCTIEKFVTTGNKASVVFQIDSADFKADIFKTKISRKDSTTASAEIKFSLDSVNSCACSKRLSGLTRQIVATKKDTTNSVVDLFYKNRINAHYSEKEQVIDYKSEKAEIQEIILFDLKGNQLKHINCYNKNYRLDTSDLNKGIYLSYLRVGSDTKKIVLIIN